MKAGVQLGLFCVLLISVGTDALLSCVTGESAFTAKFFNAVRNCTEDPNAAMRLRSMLTDDMVWKSADNVTFLGGDTFTFYTCTPHVGVILDHVIVDRIDCDLVPKAGPYQWGYDIHIDHKSMLMYNLTRNPLTWQPIDAKCFFKEVDDFKMVSNPVWTFFSPPSVPRFLVKEISSFASPREFYKAIGLLPPDFEVTKRSWGSFPPYWAFVPSNTIVTNASISLEDMYQQY